MNYYILQEVSYLFKKFKKVNYIARIDDNLIKLVLDDMVFFINLSKSNSSVFCCKDSIMPANPYKAPFDFALHKYCLKADIIDCKMDGNNRILILSLEKKFQYKKIECMLYLEFTGKYTNAIIVDSNFIILESLRKISRNSRVIKNGVKLVPIPQQDIKNIKNIDFNGDIISWLYSSYEASLNSNLHSFKKSIIDNLNTKKIKLLELLHSLPNKSELLELSAYYSNIGYIMQNNAHIEINDDSAILIDYTGNKCVVNLSNFNSRHPSKMINECFTKSKKLNTKANNISLQEENLTSSIAMLDSKIYFISNAKSMSDIRIVCPKHSRKNLDNEKSQYEIFFVDGVKISIGRNKNENISLLKSAKANDFWMHIRDIPSSHLIIHCSKSKIRDEIILKAGEILVGFVRFKSGKFEVDYARRKFVKIVEGANVVYSNYSTITIIK